MENVLGLTQRKAKPYFQSLLSSLASLGYHINWSVLTASDYGVPQNRKRVIIIGSLERLLLFPKPTHGTGDGLKPLVVSRDILPRSENEERPNSPVKYAQYPDLRPNPYGGHVYNGGGRPIDPNAPCHTVYASAGGYKTHWIDTLHVAPEYHRHLMEGGKPREGVVPGALRLSVKESARIQTFPETLEFSGSRSSQYTQVGDAVPPLLAEAVGKSMVSQINNKDKMSDLLEPSRDVLYLQHDLGVLAA
jgi:DNA (cytosine-5)-methyltransferase 1